MRGIIQQVVMEAHGAADSKQGCVQRQYFCQKEWEMGTHQQHLQATMREKLTCWYTRFHIAHGERQKLTGQFRAGD